MKPKRQTLFLTFSLVALIIFSVVWIRSYWRIDILPHHPFNRGAMIESVSGRLILGWETGDRPKPSEIITPLNVRVPFDRDANGSPVGLPSYVISSHLSTDFLTGVQKTDSNHWYDFPANLPAGSWENGWWFSGRQLITLSAKGSFASDGTMKFYTQELYGFAIPYWVVDLVAAVIALCLWLMHPTRRARRRLGAGLCPKCAYDLRGSPDRCP